MKSSITETLEKINTEISWQAFLAISTTLLILISFFLYKSYKNQAVNSLNPVYAQSSFTPKKGAKFIYASSRGSKYYYATCESSIKETNKIYFASVVEAEKAGYTLAKACQ